LLQVRLQAGAVLALERTQLINLLLEGAACSRQLRHHLLMLGFRLALGVLGLTARRREHRLRF
jgi:hypothetical protein